MNGTAGMIILLLALLGVTSGIGYWAWLELAEVELSMHGTIALISGSVATLLLGVGLMWLAYYSHKQGYDDEAGKD